MLGCLGAGDGTLCHAWGSKGFASRSMCLRDQRAPMNDDVEQRWCQKLVFVVTVMAMRRAQYIWHSVPENQWIMGRGSSQVRFPDWLGDFVGEPDWIAYFFQVCTCMFCTRLLPVQGHFNCILTFHGNVYVWGFSILPLSCFVKLVVMESIRWTKAMTYDLSFVEEINSAAQENIPSSNLGPGYEIYFHIQPNRNVQ